MQLKNTKLYLLLLLFMSVAMPMRAQLRTEAYNARVMEYVQKYKALAIAEQKRIGMPAAVILAQGILETEAGSSELATLANNHFGIKCKSDWKGPSIAHTDDRPNECFRKYKSASESYRDHSDYLKNTPRYASLFQLSITDYAAWAFGLKRCGYATSNTYAQRLIGYIEDFKLQQYTYEAISNKASYYAERTSAAPVTAPIMQEQPTIDTPVQKPVALGQSLVSDMKKPAAVMDSIKPVSSDIKETVKIDTPKRHTQEIFVKDTVFQAPANISTQAVAAPLKAETTKSTDENKIVNYHGLKAFYARKGDMLLSFAIKNNIRYAKLLELNDLADEPLPCDMYIFLEKKGISGFHATHTVQDGETLIQIAQMEGMQLRHLLANNHLNAGDMPPVGTKLFLQSEGGVKLPLLNNNKNNGGLNTTTRSASGAPYVKHIVADTAGMLATGKVIQPTVATAAPVKPVINESTAIHTSHNSKIKAAIIDTVASTTAAPVAETKPQEPQVATVPTPKEDKLARLKAKLDKVVYSSEEPQVVAPAANVPTTKTVVAAPASKSSKPSDEPAKFYTVKDGDTMFGIARRFNISIHQLNSWNNLDMDSGIKKGMKLRIKE